MPCFFQKRLGGFPTNDYLCKNNLLILFRDEKNDFHPRPCAHGPHRSRPAALPPAFQPRAQSSAALSHANQHDHGGPASGADADANDHRAGSRSAEHVRPKLHRVYHLHCHRWRDDSDHRHRPGCQGAVHQPPRHGAHKGAHQQAFHDEIQRPAEAGRSANGRDKGDGHRPFDAENAQQCHSSRRLPRTPGGCGRELDGDHGGTGPCERNHLPSR